MRLSRGGHGWRRGRRSRRRGSKARGGAPVLKCKDGCAQFQLTRRKNKKIQKKRAKNYLKAVWNSDSKRSWLSRFLAKVWSTYKWLPCYLSPSFLLLSSSTKNQPNFLILFPLLALWLVPCSFRMAEVLGMYCWISSYTTTMNHALAYTQLQVRKRIRAITKHAQTRKRMHGNHALTQDTFIVNTHISYSQLLCLYFHSCPFYVIFSVLSILHYGFYSSTCQFQLLFMLPARFINTLFHNFHNTNRHEAQRLPKSF